MKNKFGLKSFIPVGISLLTFAAFVGSISGSLAWWAYSTRASVGYEGTSVSTSEQLQIGLKLLKTQFDDDEVNELIALGLTEDLTLTGGANPYRYLFAKAGGGMSSEIIKKYLELEGTYAVDQLCPVTSREYVEGQNLTLYENVMTGHSVNEAEALKNKYVFLPFTFRILKLNAVDASDLYADGRRIYVSKAVAETPTSGTSTIQNALRVHFNNGYPSTQFILNAGDTVTTDPDEMYTPVAGLLDLDDDGTYDASDGTEVIYGDYSGTASNIFVQSTEPTKLANTNGIAGLSDSDLENMDNSSTFLAMHGKGNTCYEDYSGLTFGKAYYKTLAQIKPNDNHAVLTGGRVIATTAGSSGNFIAELGVTIWLEGWDHAIVDKAQSQKFNLGLQFQIDLVN